MKKREMLKRGCAVLVIVAMFGYYCLNGGDVRAAANGTERMLPEDGEAQGADDGTKREQAGNGGNTKDYIVKTSSERSLSKIKDNYSSSDEINENKKDMLEENQLASVELSGLETAILEQDENVVYVEEDAIVEASAASPAGKKAHIKERKRHKMQENRQKKNKSSAEWNVRMIKADKKTNKKEGKPAQRIKVAVLDSGIDWGNDINLAYQVSLVPDEEEMTQIFMDGTGHGTSVASLIAAEDDDIGVTGINSNVDIYSYRVLDDANQAPVSRVVEAIYMAIEKKVNIINMSFGLNTDSETLREAVQAAKEAGILIIAAAGNTGDKGVQYPAAYEDVVAVGAVNKDGLVEDYSAKGEEVELVAPGELVRTTGFVGTEEVTLGTSLAAPQVAAVAALIWQKDTKVSVDFVRGLLNESANLYGRTDEYGNGLVDAEYALSHYNEYKRKYKDNNRKTKQLIAENKSGVTTFEDTGCIEGSWSQSLHDQLVGDSSKICVRAGARFPDFSGKKEFTYGGTEYEYNMGTDKNRVFAGMSVNGWWHGYFATNYIKAVIYAARMGNEINAGRSYTAASNSFDYNGAFYMRQGIGSLYANSEIGWKYILYYIKKNNKNNTNAQNQKNSKGFKKAVLWGMALHAATDTYAHSAQIKSGRIKHTGGYTDADDKTYIGTRYQDAAAVARKIMNKYITKGELTAWDLTVPGNHTVGYELINYQTYMRQADASMSGYKYTYSYSSGSK